MMAEVAEFYGCVPGEFDDLIALHLHLDAMHGVRMIRERWDDLTPEGVKKYATRAYGKHRGMREVVRKVQQEQLRKMNKE